MAASASPPQQPKGCAVLSPGNLGKKRKTSSFESSPSTTLAILDLQDRLAMAEGDKATLSREVVKLKREILGLQVKAEESAGFEDTIRILQEEKLEANALEKEQASRIARLETTVADLEAGVRRLTREQPRQYAVTSKRATTDVDDLSLEEIAARNGLIYKRPITIADGIRIATEDAEVLMSPG